MIPRLTKSARLGKSKNGSLLYKLNLVIGCIGNHSCKSYASDDSMIPRLAKSARLGKSKKVLYFY